MAEKTTFTLPDLQQKFPIGKGVSAALGATGGSTGHTHGITADGTHGHTVSAHSHVIDTQAAHTHTGTTDATIFGTTGITSGFDSGVTGGHTHPFTTGADGAHNHGGDTSEEAPSTDSQGSHAHGAATGSGGDYPPFVTVNYLILAGA